MKTVQDLVPGDPGEIWLLADAYNRMARRCEEIGLGLRATDVGGWSGRAAEAFHARFEQQPKRFLTMADSYGRAAEALDTYAGALAWAQRQAVEVIQSDPPRPEGPALTASQQAELTGVITGADEPEPARADERELARGSHERALAMLNRIGDASATALRAAAEAMPASFPALSTVTPVPPPTRSGLVVHEVLRPPAPRARFEPPPRDDLRAWAAAIREIRRRLRWDSLDRLSPRLAQHVFDGHYRPSRMENTGYHHREGGVDRGVLRVVDIVDGPDRNGVYVARVRGPRTPSTETKISTFFPDAWSRAEVLHAVRQAFLDAIRNRDYDPVTRRFRGEYNGVRIEGYLKRGAAEPRLYDIVTAYPRRARKRRKRT
ncbi:MAG TPA: EndoU domain-containing protein [Actinophytocola sp.]|nr:EndoU domain-containing protein [Actinophytocola sp.]